MEFQPLPHSIKQNTTQRCVEIINCSIPDCMKKFKNKTIYILKIISQHALIDQDSQDFITSYIWYKSPFNPKYSENIIIIYYLPLIPVQALSSLQLQMYKQLSFLPTAFQGLKVERFSLLSISKTYIHFKYAKLEWVFFNIVPLPTMKVVAWILHVTLREG